jgi:hypothetical protein
MEELRLPFTGLADFFADFRRLLLDFSAKISGLTSHVGLRPLVLVPVCVDTSVPPFRAVYLARTRY